MKLVTAAQMRELDRSTIEDVGVPGVVLMEVAGRSVADVIGQSMSLTGLEVVVLSGRGNNGGDGYVAARHLWSRGADVEVFVLAPRERIKGDALVNLKAIENLGLPIRFIESAEALDEISDAILGADCIVDAMLGTGLDSEVRGIFAQAIEVVNKAEGLRVAVDVPSGLHADQGVPLGSAVQADMTVTFGLAKVGLCTYPGAEFVGDLHVADIGIPSSLVQELDPPTALIEESEILASWPARRMGGHKGTYGHLLVLAGSTGKAGAALLCGEAGLRVGAGLVTLATPADVQRHLQAEVPELMTKAYADDALSMDVDETTDRLVALTATRRAVALGPGIPTTETMQAVIEALLPRLKVPMVIDADGLNLLVGRLDVFRHVAVPVVLTPHPGEMARLVESSTAKVQQDRIAVALSLVDRTGAWVVLKGARTIIAGPHGTVWINPTGNPGMGTAGAGDVLTGMVGGLLAQGWPTADAVRAAVFAHGKAGDKAAEALGLAGLTASDLLGRIPAVLREWEQLDVGGPASS